MHDFVVGVSDWLARTVLKDFHLGMAERLAEALKRREIQVGLARQAAVVPGVQGASTGPSVAEQACQLSLAELRSVHSYRLPHLALRRR